MRLERIGNSAESFKLHSARTREELLSTRGTKFRQVNPDISRATPMRNPEVHRVSLCRRCRFAFLPLRTASSEVLPGVRRSLQRQAVGGKVFFAGPSFFCTRREARAIGRLGEQLVGGTVGIPDSANGV